MCSPPPPPGKYVAKICTRRLRPKVQPLILLNAIWKERVALSYTYYWEKARTYLPLTPRAFRREHNFKWKFWRFSAWKWAKLVLIYSKRHLQHDRMSFFPIAPHFTTFFLGHAQNSKLFWTFSPFLIFLLQWLTFYWACFQFKISEKASSRWANFTMK